MHIYIFTKNLFLVGTIIIASAWGCIQVSDLISAFEHG